MKQLLPRKTGSLHRKSVQKNNYRREKIHDPEHAHIFVRNIKNVLAVEKECMEILPKQGEKITRPDITIIARIP